MTHPSFSLRVCLFIWGFFAAMIIFSACYHCFSRAQKIGETKMWLRDDDGFDKYYLSAVEYKQVQCFKTVYYSVEE